FGLKKTAEASFGKLAHNHSRALMTPSARAQTLLETLLVSMESLMSSLQLESRGIYLGGENFLNQMSTISMSRSRET
ncbi:hypothetical protein HPG69_000706, partial [Diceros bicornis minor]